MPGLLLHFYEVDAASLTYAYHHQFVIYKKIVACRLGQAYPDGQWASQLQQGAIYGHIRVLSDIASVRAGGAALCYYRV